MNIDNPADKTSKTNHWFNLLMIAVFTLIGMFIGNTLGLIVVLPFFGFNFEVLIIELMSFQNPQSRLPMLIVQGITAVCAFIVVPVWLLKRYNIGTLKGLFPYQNGLLFLSLLTVAITICAMFANSPVIEWNKQLNFPDYLGWFESYAAETEAFLEKATIFLTNFDNPGQFFLAIIVIALVPAIGEELLFRGLIQKELRGIFENPHVAIWLAALVFSVFHRQFYGLVPRMLLGALFGYLYYWSGSLTYASIAHFVNNGFTLVMLYLHQQGLISFDIQETESTPLETVVIFLIIGGILTYIFVRYHQKKPTLLNE